MSTRIAVLVSLLALTSCGGDQTGPSGAAYFMALEDRPCGTEPAAADTIMQPSGLAPNAGSGYIDSVIPMDRPPRTALWVTGFSTLFSPTTGDLTFILLHVPNPLPVGVYQILPLADSTVFLDGYSAPWAARGVPFDMTEDGFVTAPFTGAITVEESDTAGIVGRFTLEEGRYLFDNTLRCMSASGRFSTRQH